MINEILINKELLSHRPEKLHTKELSKKQIEIKCLTCNNFNQIKILESKFFVKKYICKKCYINSLKGKTHPFYRKKHKDETKQKLSKIRKGQRTGENGTFFGRKHTEETKQKISQHNKEYYKIHKSSFLGKHHTKETKEKLSMSLKGKLVKEKNPFYGKTHTEETKLKIINGNKNYREKNKEKLIETSLIKLNKTIRDFQKMLDEYINSPINLNFLQEKYNTDKRTIQSYWIKLNLITKEKLREITMNKKLYSNPSTPEYILYKLLEEKLGLKIKQSFELDGFFYDICISDKFLIEYDGYYWHEILKNKSDKIKNKLAIENKYCLIRVKESNRFTKNPNLNNVSDEIINFIKQFDNQPTPNPIIFYLQNS